MVRDGSCSCTEWEASLLWRSLLLELIVHSISSDLISIISVLGRSRTELRPESSKPSHVNGLIPVNALDFLGRVGRETKTIYLNTAQHREISI